MADYAPVSPLLHEELIQKGLTYRIDSRTSKKNDPSIREVYPTERSESLWDRLSFRKYELFIGLSTTTLIGSLLLASHIGGSVLPARYQVFITQDRATTQIIVQVLASILGFLQFAPICAVINRATRLRLSHKTTSLDDLRFWSLLCSRSLGWDLPSKKLILLLLFLFIGLNPATIWAGALTPISVDTLRLGHLRVPSYSNISMIKEYPSEFGNAAYNATVRNTKGVFSYSVGITFEGALLSTAASATTVDGSPRRHSKLDNSGLIYNGRSYGVGSSAGLTDDSITEDHFTIGYTYQEVGYKSDVSCIYNSSTEFVLQSQPSEPLVWEAMGTLPNSNGVGELSMYFGRGDGPAIVAVGVAAHPTIGTQYLGIAAGEDYKSLNQTQCAVNFVPTMFNITVQSAGNLTVVPVSSAPDIDPSGNITHTAIRQMELIANDQTNLYQSLLGNSFFASIGDYIVSQASLPSPPSAENATLSGLQNSVAAMLDDILGQYASAQLMVGNQSDAVEAQVMVASMQIGQRVYVLAEVVINIIVLLLVIGEGVRTRGWRGLVEWDYMDVRCLVVGSFKGGRKRGGGRKSMFDDDVSGDMTGGTKVRFEKEKGALVLGSEERGK